MLSPEVIQEGYEASVNAWQGFCPKEPYDFVASSQIGAALAYVPMSSYDVAAAAHRQSGFNYQISLPHFTSPKFLLEAVTRYQRFLLLKQTYPREFLTPTHDFDLVWHSLQVHPKVYAADCIRLLGQILKHDDDINDRTPGSKLLTREAITRKLWLHHFPSDHYWRRGCMYRGHAAPRLLDFENQDLSHFTYGNIHIGSITLKEIPAQRKQLWLKLVYDSAKISTFNADLTCMEVTKQGFGLVWQQPTERSDVSSFVKFPFKKRTLKDLIIKLHLYDKVFLQKKKSVRLIGRIPLGELLPPSNSKLPLPQNVASTNLLCKDGTGARAKVSITTSVTQSRELQLNVGEFMGHELLRDTGLYDMCELATLSKCQMAPGKEVWLGMHW